MYSLICPSDSPPGGGRTVPRTVSRTAVREDLSNSDGHSDSPLGGPLKIRQSHGQPFGRHSRTKTETTIFYRVAHIRCHLSGRASPSITSSHRNLDNLSALRNYFAGREREARSLQWHLYLRKSECGECISTSIYRITKGVSGNIKNPKCPHFMSHIKGHKGMTSGSP